MKNKLLLAISALGLAVVLAGASFAPVEQSWPWPGCGLDHAPCYNGLEDDLN